MRKKKLLFIVLMFVLVLILPACMNRSQEPSLSEVETGNGNTIGSVAESREEQDIEVEGSEVRNNEESQESEGVVVEERQGSAESETIEKKGSATKANTENKQIFSLRISQGYGATILAEEELSYHENISVMDALYSVYPDDVETAYGGSYVKGISSLRAEVGGLGKTNKDWFFFVNGIFADTGALDYLPQAGERLWWDYHPWQMFQAVNAVIGCYPEPFLHGYRGKPKATTILYSAAEKELAYKLQEGLTSSGVQKIIIYEISEEFISKREGPTIVLGVWPELKKNKHLDELNQGFRKNGTFVHFTDESIELLDYTGKKGNEFFGGVGVIATSGKAAGDDSPLWIISGMDEEGIKNAAMILVERPGKIAGYFSAAVTSKEEVIRLPLLPK